MGKAGKPRGGSMGVWPRKRAKRAYARVRSWAASKDAKALGFMGYKAGMTHLMVTDNRPNSQTKGKDIMVPVTVVECPTIKTASIILYKKTPYGLTISTACMAPKLDKELGRKISLPKNAKQKIDSINPAEYADIKLLVYTQPSQTGIGKKKPEIFEMGIGGSIEEKWNYAKEKLGKEIALTEVMSEGQSVDAHAITTGKGFQGPVKRFGIAIRGQKSEKTKRGPGSLGGWSGHAHFMYRVAHAGQMGYHQRTDYNKQIIKIGENGEEINPKGGFVGYGLVKNPYVLIKGSVPGCAKRLIRFNTSIRPNKKMTKEAPAVVYVSQESQQ